MQKFFQIDLTVKKDLSQSLPLQIYGIYITYYSLLYFTLLFVFCFKFLIFWEHLQKIIS